MDAVAAMTRGGSSPPSPTWINPLFARPRSRAPPRPPAGLMASADPGSPPYDDGGESAGSGSGAGAGGKLVPSSLASLLIGLGFQLDGTSPDSARRELGARDAQAARVRGRAMRGAVRGPTSPAMGSEVEDGGAV